MERPQRALDEDKCIALGVPAGGLLAQLASAAGIASDLEWAGDEGYVISALSWRGREVLLVAANTPQGVHYGAARAASLAGTRVYLSREVARSLHAAFSSPKTPWPAVRIAERPKVARLLHQAEVERWFADTVSAEFLSYTLRWGRLVDEKRDAIEALLADLQGTAEEEPPTRGGMVDGDSGTSELASQGALAAAHPRQTSGNAGAADLAHATDTLRFVLLLDRWARAMGQAQSAMEAETFDSAVQALQQAPVLATFRAYMARVSTQGELGVLASLNQKAWLAYCDMLDELATRVHTGWASAVAPTQDGVERRTVLLPVRRLWQRSADTRIAWRVITGHSDVAGVYLCLRFADGSQRRYPLKREGPCRFRLDLRPRDVVGEGDTVLHASIETVPLAGGKAASMADRPVTIAVD